MIGSAVGSLILMLILILTLILVLHKRVDDDLVFAEILVNDFAELLLAQLEVPAVPDFPVVVVLEVV